MYLLGGSTEARVQIVLYQGTVEILLPLHYAITIAAASSHIDVRLAVRANFEHTYCQADLE